MGILITKTIEESPIRKTTAKKKHPQKPLFCYIQENLRRIDNQYQIMINDRL